MEPCTITRQPTDLHQPGLDHAVPQQRAAGSLGGGCQVGRLLFMAVVDPDEVSSNPDTVEAQQLVNSDPGPTSTLEIKKYDIFLNFGATKI